MFSSSMDVEFLYYKNDFLLEKLLLINPIIRFFKYQKSYKEIIRLLGHQSKIYNMYIFADQNPYTQFIIHKYKDSAFNLVQDGLAQYVYHKLPRTNKYKKFYYKFMIGSFWKGIEKLGDYVSYKKLYIIHPELVHEDYKNYDIKGIELGYIYSDLWKNFSVNLLNKGFKDFFEMDNSCGMVFVSRFNSKKEVQESSDYIVKIAIENKINKIFIKNHPRSKFKITSLNDEIKLFNIPDYIPAECFFALNENSKNNFYLAYSTLLLIAIYRIDKERLNVLSKDFDRYTYDHFVRNDRLCGYIKANMNIMD